MTEHKTSSIILLCIIAQIVNIASVWFFGDVLHIPLFMDTIGTVFIVFYAGLIPGMIVAVSYNLLRIVIICLLHNPISPWEGMYALCGAAIVFFTWLFYWKNQNFYLCKTLSFLYLLLISLVTAFASSIIGGTIETIQRIFFMQEVYENPVSNFVMAFLGQNIGVFVSCTFARIPITVLDRIICTYLAAFIFHLVKERETADV